MTIRKYKKRQKLNRYLFYPVFLLLGICIGLLVSWCLHREHTGLKPAAIGINPPKAEGIDLVVDYPFSYSMEDWQLVLHEDCTENGSVPAHTNREFRLYNGDGQLIQTFPCGLEAETLTFQFDHLFYYYKFDEDLVVFPADASETCAKGLCYPWDNETKKFSEDPVEIPWYQKSSFDTAFLTTETEGNTVTSTICRINEESRQVVELRKWTLTKEEQGDRGTLQIRDCLIGQDLYLGAVEFDSLGNLVNDKYYQYLFWQELETFGSWKNDEEIETTRLTQDDYEKVTYQNREELLADCGFQGKEPFYEYYDSFHRLELELFFDERTGQGCGICYAYNFNYALEQVTRCQGFSFDQVTTETPKPEDTFSTLSVYGDDARADNVSGYKETYEYTDDWKLSSFEARGTIVNYGEEKGEDKLLSMDYVYRNDKTLYHKQYYHHHILFGSTHRSQSCCYDEQGRITCKYSYVTHGSYQYYYIYRDDSEQPSYCLMLDGAWPDMISYSN